MQESFRQAAASAKEKTTPISPDSAYAEMLKDPGIILVETRDPANVPPSDRAENVIFITMETFEEQAALDPSERSLNERFSDPNQRIITT